MVMLGEALYKWIHTIQYTQYNIPWARQVASLAKSSYMIQRFTSTLEYVVSIGIMFIRSFIQKLL